MVPGTLAFLGGVLLFYSLPSLPSTAWLVAIPALWPVRRFAGGLPAWFCAGLLYSLAHAHWNRPPSLPEAALGRTVVVEGEVTGLPHCRARRCAFLFDAHVLETADRRWRGRWRLRLAAYDASAAPVPGERWRLPVRVRSVVGYRNPGGFDYAGWLYARGVRYSGYVKGETLRLATGRWSLDRLRWKLSQALDAVVKPSRAAALVRALVVGDRGGLTHEDKAVFAATGTSHLVAISGLHVGLVAGFAWWVTAGLWRFVPGLCGRWPARVAGAPAAMAAALAYAALAGFSLPTRRALVMLLVAAAAVILRRHAVSWRVLAVAALLVLVMDPQSVREAGFWLSFGAVALIFLVLRHRPGRFSWLWVQPVVSLGLNPVLALQGMVPSLLSPLVNLLAVPAFSFLLVPSALVVTGMEWALDWPGNLPAVVLGGMAEAAMDALAWAARWNPAWPGGGFMVWVPAFLAVTAVTAGRWSVRRLGLLAFGCALVSMLGRPPSPPRDGFELTLLDVGQGLAAVVRTRHHLMVYDTGPAFASGFDTGRAVVVPYLRRLDATRVDLLVLSHADQDHQGGAGSLLRAVPVEAVLSGEPERLALRRVAAPCRAGDRWWWDGVRFEVLWPERVGARGNDASCVLRISVGEQVLLLTGDLEAAAEKRLVARWGPRLAATVVVAAHHGSAGSSSSSFVAATRPRWVLFSAGHGNRWGFPRPEVVARWCRSGAQPLNTATSGALRLTFSAQGGVRIDRWRRFHGRWWEFRPHRHRQRSCGMIEG